VIDHKGYAFPPHVPPLHIVERGIGGEAPVVQWTSDRELLAWRAWRLAILVEEDVRSSPSPEGRGGQGVRTDGRGGQGVRTPDGSVGQGVRLLSLSAPCIWDGPAIRVEVVPSAPPENPSGIYALKPAVAEGSAWPLGDYCWVTGTVALSGRVVEHALGYRAECAVIRELRLGVGTHLAVRALETLRQLMASLEERYQAPVDAGLAEREVADRRLTYGFKPRCPNVPSVSSTPPWRVV